jgi:putative flippase GtrA
VGLINTLFGYLLFIFLIWLNLHYWLALLISQIIGVLFNYKTTGYLVFENKSNKLIFYFFLVYGFMYLINVLELYFLDSSSLYENILSLSFLDFIDNLPLNQDKIGNAIGQAIVIIPNSVITFFLNKIFVFKDEKTKE